MEVERRNELEAVMHRMAAGDPAAVWSMADQFQTELKREIRQHLGAINRADLRSDDQVVAGLVIDAALVLFGSASSWQPDGALPWVWARLALRKLVSATAGDMIAVAESEQSCQQAASTFPAAEINLDELAVRDPLVAKLRDAIAVVGSDRDQRVHVDYRTQQANGDPSPSHTVADTHGLTPANVRQIDRRMKTKLRRLAADDKDFSELEDLRWLA